MKQPKFRSLGVYNLFYLPRGSRFYFYGCKDKRVWQIEIKQSSINGGIGFILIIDPNKRLKNGYEERIIKQNLPVVRLLNILNK